MKVGKFPMLANSRAKTNHVECRPGTARPDDSVETAGPLAEGDLRVWKRRGSLLQHDERPAAFGDAAPRRPLIPVVFEAESAEDHAGRADRRSSALAGLRLDHCRQSVRFRQTVPDEQDAAAGRVISA